MRVHPSSSHRSYRPVILAFDASLDDDLPRFADKIRQHYRRCTDWCVVVLCIGLHAEAGLSLVRKHCGCYVRSTMLHIPPAEIFTDFSGSPPYKSTSTFINVLETEGSSRVWYASNGWYGCVSSLMTATDCSAVVRLPHLRADVTAIAS